MNLFLVVYNIIKEEVSIMNFYQQSVEELIQELQTNKTNGLSVRSGVRIPSWTPLKNTHLGVFFLCKKNRTVSYYKVSKR